MMKVLLVGAGGYFGSIMVAELLEHTNCELILAGRSLDSLRSVQSKHEGKKSRTSLREIHLDQSASVESALAEVDIAICAAGPFQDLSHLLLEHCIRRGIHYIDMADDRAYVSTAHAIASEQRLFTAVCSGWSTVPALSAVLVEIVRNKFDTIEEIQIQIAPGNRSPRAPATVASLLSSLGHSFDICQQGKWNKVKGWSARRNFHFPHPVGPRAGYLVDVPDVALFPELFGADTVEFRAGAEVDLFNRGLTLLRTVSSTGAVKSWRTHQPSLQFAMGLFGWIGTDTGALGVEMSGRATGEHRSIRACIMADHKGQNIPVMPAVIMVSQIVSGQTAPAGIIPYNTWLTRGELEAECRRRHYRLIIEEGNS